MKAPEKHYNLTEAQKMLLYSQKWTLLKQVNNIFILMLVREELDFGIMRRAIERAYDTCDTLRIRFFKADGEFGLRFLEKETPDIRELDFTGQTREQMDAKLHKLARKPFHVTNRLMTRFWLIKSYEGMQGIFLGVSHMVLDSWGICVLMRYIVDTYWGMKNGTALPVPLQPYEPLHVKDLEYPSSPQHGKDLEFWREELKQPEPIYTHINGTGFLEAYRKKKKDPALRYASHVTLLTVGRHEVLTVPKEEMDELKAYCAAHNLPMQAMFMLGLRTALSMRNDRQSDIIHYSSVARRGTKSEKNSGGTRVHALAFRTVLPEDMTFEAAAEEMSVRQGVIYRHAEFGLLEFLPMMQKAYCRNDPLVSHLHMCFTFQPLPLTIAEGKEGRTMWYCNGASSQPLYLTVMDDDGSGALRCYYEYQPHAIKPETIRSFNEDMRRVMLTGVRNPDITVGELLDGKTAPQKAAQPEQTA